MNNEHGNSMDNNLNFSTANVANPLSSGASVSSQGVEDSLSTPMNGKEFANLMRDLINKSGRQDVPLPRGKAPIRKGWPKPQKRAFQAFKPSIWVTNLR